MIQTENWDSVAFAFVDPMVDSTVYSNIANFSGRNRMDADNNKKKEI